MKPVRIQLSRAKGWRIPANTVVVSRPSKWGNPFDWREAADEYGCTEFEAKATAAMIYRDWLTMSEPERFHPDLRGRRVSILADISSIRGKSLACWCKAGAPCHADVLLELANTPPCNPLAPPASRGDSCSITPDPGTLEGERR